MSQQEQQSQQEISADEVEESVQPTQTPVSVEEDGAAEESKQQPQTKGKRPRSEKQMEAFRAAAEKRRLNIEARKKAKKTHKKVDDAPDKATTGKPNDLDVMRELINLSRDVAMHALRTSSGKAKKGKKYLRKRAELYNDSDSDESSDDESLKLEWSDTEYETPEPEAPKDEVQTVTVQPKKKQKVAHAIKAPNKLNSFARMLGY